MKTDPKHVVVVTINQFNQLGRLTKRVSKT